MPSAGKFATSVAKIRKVESKTKKIISFFAETEYLRHLPDGNVLANEQAPQASSDEKTRAGQKNVVVPFI